MNYSYNYKSPLLYDLAIFTNSHHRLLNEAYVGQGLFLQVCDACKGAHKNISSLAQRANKNRTLWAFCSSTLHTTRSSTPRSPPPPPTLAFSSRLDSAHTFPALPGSPLPSLPHSQALLAGTNNLEPGELNGTVLVAILQLRGKSRWSKTVTKVLDIQNGYIYLFLFVVVAKNNNI